MGQENFDVVVVGTGFASSFFLREYLRTAPRTARVLVLERGPMRSHQDRLRDRHELTHLARASFTNSSPEKRWVFTPGFGGGSNCWWGCTPRLRPSDFEMRSRYEVGVDWPVGYDDLEPFYVDAEAVMQISGPRQAPLPFPMSRPYPQPPHSFNAVDRLLERSFPDTYFHQPTARARKPTRSRPRCCASNVCSHCPVDAKFTILNGLSKLYQDPRVTLRVESPVERLEMQGGNVARVIYRAGESPKAAGCDLAVLGANAIFNPHILLRSGLTDAKLGRGLHEQVSVRVTLDLDGVDNFQGSTSITGNGYMFYDTEDRREFAACLLENHNIPLIRPERGRWQQRMQMKLIFEDLPQNENRVELDPDQPDRPRTVYQAHSDYTQRGIDRVDARLERLFGALPVERVVATEVGRAEGHILGTTAMSKTPSEGIVDRELKHHTIRNLIVLGGSVFPMSGPSNPTLTICALSLWAARHL